MAITYLTNTGFCMTTFVKEIHSPSKHYALPYERFLCLVKTLQQTTPTWSTFSLSIARYNVNLSQQERYVAALRWYFSWTQSV